MGFVRNFRFNSLSISLLSVFCLLVISTGVAHALNNQSIVQGTSNQTIYRAGSNVDVTGIVNGDIFCAGQTVNIDAQINGDVICAAQTITINGKVSGDIRLIGQTINIGATVTNNASLAGQTIVLQNNSSIGRDVLIAGQTVSLDGNIGRDVSIAANTATISSSVGRNVDAKVGNKLILTSNAIIGGSVSYTSPRIWDKSPNAQVLGSTTYHKSVPSHHHYWRGWLIIRGIYWLAAITVFSVILVALFPQLFRKWSKTTPKQLGTSLLTGFIAMILIPVLVFISFITLVGAPLGILILLLWGAASLTSAAFVSFVLGSKIVPKWHPILIVITGSVILGLIGLIPVFGWIINCLAYLIGFGIIIRNLKHSYKKPDYSLKA